MKKNSSHAHAISTWKMLSAKPHLLMKLTSVALSLALAVFLTSATAYAADGTVKVKNSDNAAQGKTGVANKSTQTTAIGSKGIGVMSTRGFARTSKVGSSEGKEAITSYRFELPYGVSSGWKLPYLGFSDGTTGSIQICSVAATIEQPGIPLARIRIKFSGKDGTVIAHDSIVESDPVDQPLLPGTVLTVSTFYRNQDPAGALPFMNWGYIDKIDGCLAGDIGTLKEASLWDNSIYRGADQPPKPLWAGLGALIRSYQPMFVTGKPHPLYTGTEVVIGFIGDSINIAQNDFGRAKADDPYPARGWNGRACGTSIPYVVFGQGGSNSGGFISAKESPLFKYIFGTGADDRKITHLIDAYGINSLRQAVNLKLDKVWLARLEVAAIVKQLGIPYIHTTLTPMTSNWLELSKDLGDAAAQFALFAAARKKFNEQVRKDSKTIPGCVGFIDWGTAVETDPANSNNIWQPAIDNDGIHPNSVGHQRMAEAVGNQFTIPNPLPTKTKPAAK